MNSSNKEKNHPFFCHLSPQGLISDFDWNPEDKWNILTSCQEADEITSGGGNLHIFRPNNLLCIDKNEAIEKLKKFKNK